MTMNKNPLRAKIVEWHWQLCCNYESDEVLGNKVENLSERLRLL